MPRSNSPKVPKYRRQAGTQGDRAFVVLNGHRITRKGEEEQELAP